MTLGYFKIIVLGVGVTRADIRVMINWCRSGRGRQNDHQSRIEFTMAHSQITLKNVEILLKQIGSIIDKPAFKS